MEFLKHSQQTKFSMTAQSADGFRIATLTPTAIEMFQFANLELSKVDAMRNVYATTIAISPSGRYVLLVTGVGAYVYEWVTKLSRPIAFPSFCDVAAINDAGEVFAMRQKSIDGIVFKVTATESTTLNFGPLYGTKRLVAGTTLKVSDATRYGTLGALTAATGLIVGFFGDFVVTADGKVKGPVSTYDFAEQIFEATDCGKFVVVRLAQKYKAIKKSNMAVSEMPQSYVAPIPAPKVIAIGTSLKAHTGEQLAIVQGDGTLTISGPAAWLSKYVQLVINDTQFFVSFVAGSVTITTNILKTAIKQIYLSLSEFDAPTETLAFSPVLLSVKSVVAFDNYSFFAGNALAGSLNPDRVSVKVGITEYKYLNRTPLMDARTLLTETNKVAFTSYIEAV